MELGFPPIVKKCACSGPVFRLYEQSEPGAEPRNFSFTDAFVVNVLLAVMVKFAVLIFMSPDLMGVDFREYELQMKFTVFMCICACFAASRTKPWSRSRQTT